MHIINVSATKEVLLNVPLSLPNLVEVGTPPIRIVWPKRGNVPYRSLAILT